MVLFNLGHSTFGVGAPATTRSPSDIQPAGVVGGLNGENIRVVFNQRTVGPDKKVMWGSVSQIKPNKYFPHI